MPGTRADSRGEKALTPPPLEQVPPGAFISDPAPAPGERRLQLGLLS